MFRGRTRNVCMSVSVLCELCVKCYGAVELGAESMLEVDVQVGGRMTSRYRTQVGRSVGR